MSSSPPQKTPIYSANDLKITTDDALTPYLTTLPQPHTFTAQHTHSTIRLSLGYSAVLIAAALFYADYKLGWDATKPYTLPACAAYFALNGALTAYVFLIERGTVFVGTNGAGQRLEVRSKGKKASAVYELEVRVVDQGGVVQEEKTVKGTFMEWFGKEGYLQRKEFAAWLARNVEVVGAAEREKERLQGQKDKSEVLLTGGTTEEEVNVLVVDAEAEEVKTPGGRKGKGRKKA